MNNIPLTIYDFLAHLSAGSVFLAALVRTFKPELLDITEVSPLKGTLLLIVAYVAGHVIAHAANYLLECKLVRDLLGKPEKMLFTGDRGLRRLIAPGYCRPLPTEIQARILERARTETTIHEPGEALFLHARWSVTSDPVVAGRLASFLNLYGFSRNMCLTLTLVLGLFLSSSSVNLIFPKGYVLPLIGFAAVVMFFRYLKYYRLYAFEVFMAYSETQCR